MIYSYQPLVPTTTPRSGRCRGLRLGSRPTFRSDTYWETLPMPYPMSYLLPIQSASASTTPTKPCTTSDRVELESR